MTLRMCKRPGTKFGMAIEYEKQRSAMLVVAYYPEPSPIHMQDMWSCGLQNSKNEALQKVARKFRLNLII